MGSNVQRISGRNYNELREITLLPNFLKHAEGSCFAKFGDTHIICTASVELKVPPWRRGSGKGWITAEYGMLPRSTNTRINREATKGKQSGRTQEIQRLIGRSLRAIVDLQSMGEIQIRIDCDVVQADGGTRTAAITGAYIALFEAFVHCKRSEIITKIPIIDSVAAVSCGIHNGQILLDLDYAEDSSADADANFILTGQNKIVEIQATAEDYPFSHEIFHKLSNLAANGLKDITKIQHNALKHFKS